MITDEERIAKITTMLKQNKLWVSQEGWDESDRDDELMVTINYLIQGYNTLKKSILMAAVTAAHEQ
tara:strand:- start:4824 stop:5021 length:198 start_codon:yes stop_codon:yes gene_type:complete